MASNDFVGFGAVITVREIAKKAGWPYLKMLRHLQARDQELSGMLLTKTGKGRNTRYTTTIGALEQLHPQWFVQTASLREEVADQATRLSERDAMLEAAHKDIGRLKFRVQELEGEVTRLQASHASHKETSEAKHRVLREWATGQYMALVKRLDALDVWRELMVSRLTPEPPHHLEAMFPISNEDRARLGLKPVHPKPRRRRRA